MKVLIVAMVLFMKEVVEYMFRQLLMEELSKNLLEEKLIQLIKLG